MYQEAWPCRQDGVRSSNKALREVRWRRARETLRRIRADEKRDGYISTKPNITPIFPFKEDGITKDDVMKILTIAVSECLDTTRGQLVWVLLLLLSEKVEWVGLKERHPDLFDSAKSYEKLDEGYTWMMKKSRISRSPRGCFQIIERSDQVGQSRGKSGLRTLADYSPENSETTMMVWEVV